MSKSIEDAARDVVTHWRLRPHAVIALDLKRAIERLAAALDADTAARGIQAAFEQRTIDHDAWARVMNGQDKPEV